MSSNSRAAKKSAMNLLDPGKMQSKDGKKLMPKMPKTNPTAMKKMTSESPKFVFWNCCRGIFNKKCFIEKYISKLSPSVLFISECDILKGQCLEQLNIKGYNLEISDTINTKNKGRLLAYVKRGFARKRELEDRDNDIIVLENEKDRVVGIYSGFATVNDETQLGNFQKLVSNLGRVSNTEKRITLGGDFNADPEKRNTKSDILNKWQSEHGYQQLVNNITRERLVGSTVQRSRLDLIFTSDPGVAKSKIQPSECSDHHLVWVMYEDPGVLIKQKKSIVIDWRKYSEEKLNAELEKEILKKSWDTYTSSTELNRDLECAITVVMNKIIPKRVVHQRRQTDIKNYRIEALKKKRDRTLKKARPSGSPNLMVIVKELNKDIKKAVKFEKNRVIKLKLENSSPQGFWRTVNSLMGRENILDEFPLREMVVDVQAADKPDKFADFFQDKVKNLISQSNITVSHNPVQTLQKTEPFTVEEIKTALSTFRPKKSFGPDEIPMMVLKHGINTLIKPIEMLFSIITYTTKMPPAWKVARIKPIFKKGDPTDVQNYRPISNLNSISK